MHTFNLQLIEKVLSPAPTYMTGFAKTWHVARMCKSRNARFQYLSFLGIKEAALVNED